MSTLAIHKKDLLDSAGIAGLIKKTDFNKNSVTLIGYGPMGQAYHKALTNLGAGSLTICARRPETLASIKEPTVRTVAGGFEKLSKENAADDLAVIAVPVTDLVPAVEWCLKLGYKNILCEKPVSLWSSDIKKLADKAAGKASVWCAFNRLAYPSFLEARKRLADDGGATSCVYNFTELVDRIDFSHYDPHVVARWGVANSLHVMSLAHGLIGWPEIWEPLRSGELPWHSTGSLFMGAGKSNTDVLFSYHADWGSAGRWGVEVYSHKAAYRLVPLEKVFMKKTSLAEWEEIPVTAAFADTKPGFAEQTAAALDKNIRAHIPIASITECAALVEYAEDVFGYESAQEKIGRKN